MLVSFMLHNSSMTQESKERCHHQYAVIDGLCLDLNLVCWEESVL